MRIGINCGHTLSGTTGCGAVGYLNESNETRAVGYKLMHMLKALGHTVIDCTNDTAKSVAEDLRKICTIANNHPLDLFISLHFNAGGGAGCEMYTYGSGDVAFAGNIKSALYALGFRNRGIKDGSNLYVIQNTKAPACLVEICFVDSEEDAKLYKELGAERIASAICKAITGNSSAIKAEDRSEKMIYNYIDDNMPEWARPTIQKLVDKEILIGDENGLNLTYDMLRIMVILDRTGAFDNEKQ